MELSLMGAVSTLVVAAAVMWALKILNWVWLRPKGLEKNLKQQGLTGTPYRLLFGDVKRRFAMEMEARSRPISLDDDISSRVIPFFVELVENNGKRSYTWNGPVPSVIVMNPDEIKEVFNKVYEFPKPHKHPLIKLLASGVADYAGDKWAKHRRIINPAFHLEKLKAMLPSFYRSCSNMVQKWDDIVSKEESSSCEVDVWPDLTSMTSDVISRTAFGSSYEEGKRIFQLQDEQIQLIMKTLHLVHIPGWSFLPTKVNRRMKQTDQEIRSTLRWIIEKKEEAIRTGSDRSDDLLGILLESNSGKVGGREISLEDVIKECKLFYFAGQETTSVLLVWTMVLLCHHQEWQVRARDEVLQVVGHVKPDFDSLANLKIVTMILYEVLRLFPPLRYMNRVALNETKLGDLTLPTGVELIIPTLLIHRCPDIWGLDANEFKPERFADGISKATKNQVSFLPFGWGPRICVGQNFALLEAKMALVLILRRFRFELSPSYTHAPHAAITLQPQHGAHLILHKLG